MTEQPETRGFDDLMRAEDDLSMALAYLGSADISGDEQVETLNWMRSFCAGNPDALWRTCLDGHLTGSALVVDHNLRSTLLIHHRKLDRWLQPGGHADGDGNLALVALTEATEETGVEGLRVFPQVIDVDAHTIPARGDVPAHVHLDCRFLVVAPPNAAVAADETETKGARWVGPDDPLLGDGELARLARRGLRS